MVMQDDVESRMIMILHQVAEDNIWGNHGMAGPGRRAFANHVAVI